MSDKPTLILASQSAARAHLLKQAGLNFLTKPANIDERAEEKNIEKQNESPKKIAQHLATVKALSISTNFSDAVIIGADQTLELDGKKFTKPGSFEEAYNQLLQLKGRCHTLHSAVSCVKNGCVNWTQVESAKLTMHPFSDQTLANYIEKAGDRIFESVGAYQLESIGVNLFEKVEGDFFTILGLPLLPLLAYLSSIGISVL